MEEEILWSLLHKAWQGNANKVLWSLVEGLQNYPLQELQSGYFRENFQIIQEDLVTKFFRLKEKTDLEKAKAYFAQQQIHLVKYTDSDYPEGLRNIAQPPPILYYRGSLPPKGLRIGIVGSRKADRYGKLVAEQLAQELSQAGVCVISGLARGIDGAAHQGALQGNGGTVAVLGCGIDVVYPAEHRSLALQICQHDHSGVLSEFPLGTQPLPFHFPMRNRIISGLSDGVVVVQADRKSGALITAEMALEQGKEVFAVPGSIQQPLSAGPHQLLREGAKLVGCVEDILEEFGQLCLFQEKKVQDKDIELTPKEAQVYHLLGTDPVSVEEIAQHTKLPMAELMPILTMLEMAECIQQVIGRKYIRIY